MRRKEKGEAKEGRGRGKRREYMKREVVKRIDIEGKEWRW